MMKWWLQYLKANTLIGRRDYAAAGALFREIAAEDPGDGFAAWMVATCYEHEGLVVDALHWAEASARALPEDVRLAAFQSAARLAIATDDHEKATDYVLRALALPEVLTEMPKPLPKSVMWLLRALRYLPILRRRVTREALAELETGPASRDLQEWKEWAQGYLAWRRGDGTPEPSRPH